MPLKVPIPFSLYSGFHATVVRHLSELVPPPDGSEKRCVWLRRPGGSRALVQWTALIVHSLKSITSGMLGSAEASKVQAGVSENWAEFFEIEKTGKFRTRPEKGFM